MSRPDLDAIRARCEAATEGPWESTIPTTGRFPVATLRNPEAVDDRNIYAKTNWLNNVSVDAEFIAHARSDVPVLLDYIQRLEAALDAIASGVIPPKPSPPGTMLVLSQTAQEFAYKTMQGVRGGG